MFPVAAEHLAIRVNLTAALSSAVHRQHDRCTILCVTSAQEIKAHRGVPPPHTVLPTSHSQTAKYDGHPLWLPLSVEWRAKTVAEWRQLFTKPPVTSSQPSVRVAKLTTYDNYSRRRAAQQWHFFTTFSKRAISQSSVMNSSEGALKLFLCDFYFFNTTQSCLVENAE